MISYLREYLIPSAFALFHRAFVRLRRTWERLYGGRRCASRIFSHHTASLASAAGARKRRGRESGTLREKKRGKHGRRTGDAITAPASPARAGHQPLSSARRAYPYYRRGFATF